MRSTGQGLRHKANNQRIDKKPYGMVSFKGNSITRIQVRDAVTLYSIPMLANKWQVIDKGTISTMLTQNFIQIVIRGLTQGQQWQVSPCWTVTGLGGAVLTPDDYHTQPLIEGWFDRMWNGDVEIGTANGLADELITALPDTVSINEVRVIARNENMIQPVQLTYAANIVGSRTSAGFKSPTFLAASCFAASDDWGQRGASMRLPLLTEGDCDGNFIIPSVLTTLRSSGGLLDAFTRNANLAMLEMYNGLNGVQVPTGEVRNAVIQRVYANGPVTSGSRKEFPYLPTHPIIAHTCNIWQIHDYVGTQNSRKLGSGK